MIHITWGKSKIAAFVFLIVIAFVPRFWDLGYSNYYGDETKAIFYRKNFSAQEFFLNQRKGPLQFLITWGVEKVTGGYDETAMRLPFAMAGFVSVFVLFLALYKLFNFRIAYFSSLMYATNGFYLAFSRTVQYQSFMLLFCLLALLFAVLFYKASTVKHVYMFCTAVCLGIAFWAHYDSLFFIFPVVLLLLTGKTKILSIKALVLLFIVPLGLIAGVFYIPYIFSDYFANSTFSYLYSRALNIGSLPNNSLFTYMVYNPSPLRLLPFIFAFVPIFYLKNHVYKIIVVWFLVPFFILEILFSNPGTHIHNFVLPLIILSTIGLSILYDKLHDKYHTLSNSVLFAVLFVIIINGVINVAIYTPALNSGYPWGDSKLLFTDLPKVPKDKYQIFLYGFPYNRGWDQLRDYYAINKKNIKIIGGENYGTNDSSMLGEFYLYPLFPYPTDPSLYYFVNDNQLDKTIKETILDQTLYAKLQDFYVGSKLVGSFYVRIL